VSAIHNGFSATKRLSIGTTKEDGMRSTTASQPCQRRTRRIVCALLFLVVVAAVGIQPATLVAAATPPSFSDTLVTAVELPTALAFTPDNRMLIASQPGQLRVYQSSALLGTPALDLSAKICDDVERGLLGIAVDPGFASNHFIYRYYTFKLYISHAAHIHVVAGPPAPDRRAGPAQPQRLVAMERLVGWRRGDVYDHYSGGDDDLHGDVQARASCVPSNCAQMISAKWRIARLYFEKEDYVNRLV
jgi:hypothetical protein